MVELRTSGPTLIATQLAAAWAVGGIALPIAWRAVLIAAFAGGQGTAGVLALVTVATLLAYLIAVITATRAVSVLGGTPARRVLWALLVLGGGTIGWGSGWAVTDGVGHAVSGSLIATVILGGLPFVLTAGLLLRGWQLRTAAVGLIVALLGTGAVLLRYESPAEFDQRLEARGVYRQTAYAVAFPGYLPTDPDYGNRFGGSGFHPEDQDVVPPDRFITITAYEQVLPGGQMCGQPTARDSRLTWGECTVEPDGLVYRHNEIEHGYQVPTGDRIVTVVGTPGVDRDLLRIAVLSLTVATVADAGDDAGRQRQYDVATIPGYVGQATGIPHGMIYTPADHTGSGAASVAITMYVSYAAGEDVCFGATQCLADGVGLSYVRHEADHGYVARHGDVNVWVLGGVRVDKALLRQAALDARPATDDELRNAVPPLPAHTPVQRLRQWLRTL